MINGEDVISHSANKDIDIDMDILNGDDIHEMV